MPLLTREDWERLRNKYKVAFYGMPPDLFQLLMDKVYGPRASSGNVPSKKSQGYAAGSNPGSASGSSSEVDDTDAMMIYLVRSGSGAEPIIGP
jgi:hypothetical protein